eukprot:GEZU01028116.1.p1 GENE.GEZU01028116.1~~GEZU01028116.1.p1  ORF type:complete len:443 (+),score=109.97 GEZU01028116.1:46-1329(+)
MVRITEELLRKRSEHNEGVLSTLKEITLHQFEIEKIELVGNLCRELQILYLQNNLIGKIENLHHLKDLRYLNLAINNIQVIENLEANEMLEKLDLTMNFVSDPLCLENLQSNYNLRELYLTGNPVTQVEGYRLFAIATLQQLHMLDSQEITRTERIRAMQEHKALRAKYLKMREEGAFVLKKDDKIEYDENGERLYANTPEDRLAAHHDLEKTRNEAAKQSKHASKIGEAERLGKKEKVRLTPEEEIAKFGRIMQKNEGNWDYKLIEDHPDYTVLKVPVPKHLDTSYLRVDVQPTYVRVTVRNKILQLLLSEEVKPDATKAQRSEVTGHLKLTMPKAKQIIKKHADDLDLEEIAAAKKTTTSNNKATPETTPSNSKSQSSSTPADYTRIVKKSTDRKDIPSASSEPLLKEAKTTRLDKADDAGEQQH